MCQALSFHGSDVSDTSADSASWKPRVRGFEGDGPRKKTGVFEGEASKKTGFFFVGVKANFQTM